MVINEDARKQQLDILASIFNMNTDVDSEYKAQKLICDTLLQLKQENNLENYNITTYIKDNLKKNWKQSKSKNNEFTKIFFNEMEYAIEKYEIKRSEVLFLYSLSPYLLWEENLLVDKKGMPLNQKRLCEVLGLNRRTISDKMKYLEEKKCLIRIWFGNDTYYLVNPNLMFKGQQINKNIPELFKLVGYSN